PTVLLSESDPQRFLAGWIAACAHQCPICLGNPTWTDAEWQQVFEQIQPEIGWGRIPDNPRLPPTVIPAGWILIPTGGSSGKIRFVIHTWETLTASVLGFQQYFGVDRVNSCCTLPLYHVSGLMQLMRSLLTGGKLALVAAKSLEHKIPDFDPSDFFLSLVPTQLQRLLQNPDAIAWLSRLYAVLLGGAPAWEQLLATARQQQIRLAPTYGMTETASQVATLKPEEFLQGRPGCGRVLPHAQIKIFNPQGQEVTGQVGAIAIQSASLGLGYYTAGGQQLGNGLPGSTATPLRPLFHTDDLGYLDAAGYLHIMGRNSRKIITGGENVFPDEVEAAIRATGLVADICVVGLPDRHWGEVITAVYVPHSSESHLTQVQGAIAAKLSHKLSKFKQPKRWIAVERLPRNAQGKLNYEGVKALGG
ncbi:MAG TPA: 2-succinylbenzoate--CoA ligase, partial [Coleofasciculaceae cyanobacterium]